MERANGGAVCAARRGEVCVSGRPVYPSPGPERSPPPPGIIHHQHVWISLL